MGNRRIFDSPAVRTRDQKSLFLAPVDARLQSRGDPWRPGESTCVCNNEIRRLTDARGDTC